MTDRIAGGVTLYEEIPSPASSSSSSPPPPPPPFFCTDQPHCRIGAPPCPHAGLVTCAQVPVHLLANVAQPAQINGVPHAPGPIQVCNLCILHDRTQKRTDVNTRATAGEFSPRVPAGTNVPPGRSVGARADMCISCVRDEMKLYWHRVGTIRPAVPPANSLNHIARWPTANAGPLSAQDLCICMTKAVTMWQNDRCHACRNSLYDHYHTAGATHHEQFLRKRQKSVIKGDRQCNIQQPGRPNFEHPAATIAAREARGIGRMCPCGEKPKVQTPANAFIDVCLACMGVRVNPVMIPAEFSRASLFPPPDTRRETRAQARRGAALAAAGQTYAPTKGRRHAQRSQNVRVNIELGFLTDPNPPHAGDPFIGGQ
ncbi:hypothetical protein IQ06DRAFT_307604 [Phaeosphaeriaceae sp. SRC1lsM3a]|nr:hypothetical protein IQ06DRAFT_307604 [Stagonospora sp. SRC1lsM3a]